MGRRLSLVLGFFLCSAAALVASGGLSPRVAAAPDSFRCGYETGLGSFSASNQPDACWRPYGNASPFNLPILPGTPATADSAANVFRLLAGGSAEEFVVGDPVFDYGVPIYWSQPSDPIYTLHCTKPWGRCAIEGARIRVPAQARPAGGYATPSFDHDAHFTVIDQQSGWEYDLWNVSSKSGSTINFGWGGRTRIDGAGLGSGAVAANFGSIAGPIRIAELRGGAINHALTIAVPCTNTYIYPATGTGASCSEAGLSNGLSIPMGTHYQLNMSAAEIAALNVPAWKKTILTALATYGAYVSDTIGLRSWGFEIESRESQTSFGQPDPWVQLARSAGIPGFDSNGNGFAEYRMPIHNGVPWARLRVVSVCAARGTCFPSVSVTKAQSPSAVSAPRATKCWRKRAAWARKYRRTHDGLQKRYFRVLERWKRKCLKAQTA